MKKISTESGLTNEHDPLVSGTAKIKVPVSVDKQSTLIRLKGGNVR